MRRELAAIASAFAPYLKDGETPIERLERERHDNDLLMGALAKEKAHIEMVMRVEGQRIAARDKEIADLEIERSLADKATVAARGDRDRFQRERDEARAQIANALDSLKYEHDQRLQIERAYALADATLRDAREWHRCPWKYGASVEVIDLQRHAEWIARLDAALGGQP